MWASPLRACARLPPRRALTARARLLPSVVDAIGDTPLVELSRFVAAANAQRGAAAAARGRILAKLDFLNPGGSKKDRIARQIVEVVSLAFGDHSHEDQERALRFTRQLLACDLDGRLSDLRRSLDMTEMEFRSGIFGWRGILYYRWHMSEALAALKDFIQQIKAVSIVGASEHEYTELQHMRRAIIDETRHRWACLTTVMEEYEQVFGRFCRGEDANGFRNFLLKAPSLFYDVGSDLSVVGHVPGYWRYWAKQNSKGFLHAREAVTLFSDFIASVTRSPSGGGVVESEARRRIRSPIPKPVVVVTDAA